MKKGFTLIELLAVIIILAIVALISTPTGLDGIEDAKDEANRESVYGIIDAGRNYYAESMFNEEKNQKIENFENIYNEVVLNGKIPEEGELYVNNKGQVAISVEFDDKCYVKEFYGELQKLEQTEECKVGYVGVDNINPMATFNITGIKGENDWYTGITVVDITVLDNETGINYFNWCSFKKVEGEECNLDNKVTDLNKTIVIEDTKGVVVCVEAFDKSGNSSGLTCTDLIKVDQTAPVAGIVEIEQIEGNNGWYTNDVTLNAIDGTDEMSGHLSTEVDVQSITESTEGTKVTVTTKDKAGNSSTREYTIKIDKTKPVVTIEQPSIDGNNGWYISTPTIKATASDTISTFDKLKWCQGNNCEPLEEITETSKSIIVSDTEGTQLCVIAYDKAGNASEKTCSNVIKVDTVKPEISGIADITITRGTTVDLESGVNVSDATSKIAGTITYDPTSIDTSKAGSTNVIYTIKDKAGNEKTVTRKVTISTTAPSVSYQAASGAINSNGWANKDFYVTINVSDNSGHGIKSFNVCTATTDTCVPANGSVITGSTSTTREIITESNNNRICVQAVDNYNQTSEVICSDAYKLDKTAPIAGTIKVNGSSTISSWYTGNVTIELVNGSDKLSDHAGTTVNQASITSNTEGTKVTVTTKDKAGNSSTRDYTIRVDKNQPTCIFGALNYVGVNKIATIELTCTNSISKMSDKTLSASDFTVNNSNISITGVSKSTVTNGYKYTITLKGLSGGSSTITLPTNKVTTVAGLGNAAKTSGSIAITSVSLSSTSGTGYVGGSNLTSTITSSNAGTLSCASSSTSIATCSISGTTLTITPKSAGSATITVIGTNGNPTATYTVTSKVVTLGLSSTSGTTKVSAGNLTTAITGNNYGALTCSSSNVSIATCSITGTTLTITPKLAGSAVITVTEQNASKKVTYNVTIEQEYVCKRAEVLHTEKCSQTTQGYNCFGAGYSSGETITYGSFGTNGVLTIGDAFDCDVNGDGEYNSETERFYYIADLNVNSNYAVLIYYNNTLKGVANNTSSSKVAYDSSGYSYYGPRTAISNLPTTSQWSNVSLYSTTRAITNTNGGTMIDGYTLPTAFSYAGYAARLLTYSEYNQNSTADILVENTTFSSSSMGTAGYWMDTPHTSSSAYYVMPTFTSHSYYSSVTSTLGVRPVIEVPKSKISLEITGIPTIELSSTKGTLTTGGAYAKSTIGGYAYGIASCSSSNTSIATCSVSGSKLTIKSGSTSGTATITVTGSNNNVSTTYTATVNQGTYCQTSCNSSCSSNWGNDAAYGSCQSGCNASCASAGSGSGSNSCSVSSCCSSIASSGCASYTGADYTGCYNMTYSNCMSAHQDGQGSCCQ